MKTKNGRTTNQDYVNLLYSESDSDDPPDLKLPPLINKSKKSRKKRGTLSLKTSADQISDISNCSGVTFLKIFVIVVLLAAAAVFGVVTFWLMRQVADLKEQVDLIESQNKQGHEEFIKIQSDLKDINKSINIIKLENSNLRNNLTQIAMEYKSLTDKSSSLMTKFDTFKDLKKLSQIDTLSATTASVGSDIKDLKTNIEPAVEDLKKRIAVLENKDKSEIGIHKAKDTTLTDSTLISVTEQLSSLNNDVDSLNKSIINMISSLNGNITLKNKNITFTDSGETLSNLQIQVSNLTSVIDDLLFNHSQISEKPMILNTNLSIEIKNIQSQTMNINKTIIKLNEDVDQLFSKLTSNTNKLFRVSSTVDGLRHYIAHRENISLSSLEDKNMTTAFLTESTSPSIPSLTTVTTNPVISLPGIKTYRDLENKYDPWPKLGFSLKKLKSIEPEIDVTKEEYMKLFDKNNDGLYTLEELGAALGLSNSDVPEDLLNP